MKAKLIPYTKVDGIPTFRDSEILSLYDEMVSDGVSETVFADGEINSREDWLRSMTGGNNKLYVMKIVDGRDSGTGHDTGGIADGSAALVLWLNGFEGKVARMHWSCFKKFWNNGSVEMMRFALGEIMGLENHQGYFFDVLIGLVAVTNPRAIEFSRKCGAVAETVIPHALYSRKDSKSVDAMLVYYTREQGNYGLGIRSRSTG